MDFKIINTDKAPAAIGPYSQGLAVGQWLFVSGQIGIKPETGELISPDFSSQAHQALENLKQIVASGGCDLDHVVAVDVFLTDIKNFVEFNEIYQEYFNEHKPTRAVVEVCALPKEALLEIKCIVRQ